MSTMGGAPTDTDGIDVEVIDLVDRAQRGDGAAFTALYDRYIDQIYGYVYRRVRHRQTAEDLCGDVFLRAYRRLETFEWQGVDLGAWITTIARNRVHDHFKSARFRLERSTDVIRDEPVLGAVDDPERVALAREMARNLGLALDALKDEHREVIELRFVHGMSVAETAVAMSRTVGATKALQYRALKKLTEEVANEPLLAGIVGLGLNMIVMALRMLTP